MDANAIRLTIPTPSHEAVVLDYLDAHRQSGEPHLHGCARLTASENYADWLADVVLCADPATVPANLVPATSFLGIREADGIVTGMLQVRHALNDHLRLYGGHIGYSVRHDMRRKGYATQMLTQSLAYCRQTLSLPRVMLTCDATNTPSARTIQHCGGILTAERINPETQKLLQEYWIEL